MRPPVVKICGLQSVADAAACVAAGVDFAGLNFVPWSSRRIDARAAGTIRAALGPVTGVGVFVDRPADEVAAEARAAGLAWVQLHGHEPPAVSAALSRDFTVVKALTADRLGEAEAHAPHVAAFLVDGRQPGSGAAWAWDTVRGPHLAGRPLWLAGGLTPQTVAAARAATGALGVDAASGVARAGQLDPELIAAFCRAARGETCD